MARHTPIAEVWRAFRTADAFREMKATGSVDVSCNIFSALEPLVRLVMNLRSSWHRPTRELFETVDPELWADLRNPLEMLRWCPHSQLTELAADEGFLGRVHE